MAKKVHAVTATIGEKVGHERYHKLLAQSGLTLKIHDSTQNNAQEAKRILTVEAVTPDRGVAPRSGADSHVRQKDLSLGPRQPILKKAVDVAKAMKKAGENVVIFLRGMEECKTVKSLMLGQCLGTTTGNNPGAS